MNLDLIESKLCDIQGSLFESFANTEYDPECLIRVFMNSELSKNLDSDYNRMQWAGEEYLLEELLDVYKEQLEPKSEEYSKDALFWMGYVYRYWHYYRNCGKLVGINAKGTYSNKSGFRLFNNL